MPTTTRKPIGWFKDVPQIRKELGSESDLRNLGESLRVRQLAAVGAMSDGTPIYGFRRIKAAKLVGLPDIAVTIYEEPLSEAEINLMQLTENVHRKDMNPHEKWRAFEEIRKMNPEWSAKELATFVKLDPSAVTKWLSPSKCIPAWQEALKAGQVGITDCYTASPLSEEQQHELLKMKLGGASRDALTRAVQRSKPQTDDGSARLARIAIPLPNGNKVVISGESLSLSKVIDTLTECLEAARKGAKDHLDARGWQTFMQAKSQAVSEVEVLS